MGRHICVALQNLGVRPFVCGQRDSNLHLGYDNERYISCDLLDLTAIEHVLKSVQPTHILHLAWVMSPQQNYWSSHKNVSWIIASSHLVKTFAQLNGERFVGIGTCVEYINTSDTRREFLTPTIPDTLYGKAKLATANMTMAMSHAFGFSAAWCRPFYLLGPGEAAERLIPAACRALERHEPFRAINGKRILDYMDVRDAATAIASILLNESLIGVFNIASGSGRSIESLLLELADVAERDPRLIDCMLSSPTDAEPPAIIGDASRLYREAGFRSRYPMRQSLTDCYNHYLAEKER